MTRTLSLSLALVALLVPLSIAGTNLALGVLSVAVAGNLLFGGWARGFRAWRDETAVRAVGVYIAAGLVSTACGFGLAHSLHDSAKDFHRLWSLSLFVAALALEPEAAPWPAFAVGFSLAAAFGIRQSALSLIHGERYVRAAAFVHPVTFGEIMGIGALGGLCWLARPSARGAWPRAAAGAATLLCVTAMTLSQTRAAMLAFGFGAVVVAVLEPRARRWAAAGLCLGGLGAASAQWMRALHGEFSLAAGVTGAGAAAPAPQSRLILWRVAWRMFRDHPLTGVGLGHYSTLFDRYSPPYEGEAHWGTAHNIYLHQLAERGLVGFAALMLLFGVLLTRAWRAGKTRQDAMALWAAAAVPAFLIMNLTETALQTEQFATLFLLIWALGAARRKPVEVL
ncbi:MAG: O-antigen ligase family protein [Elusimicrobiota bacterium]